MADLVTIDYSSREVIDTIKATVAKGATDAQLAQFLQVCKATGLNPFLREVWCIPATNTIMASRDGYLRIANDNPQFDGMDTKVERDEKGLPIKAICSVYRKDRKHPVTCEAYFNEYRKDSQVWRQYPSAMISKVAEALALKRSFSINGVVTQEEIAEEVIETTGGVETNKAALTTASESPAAPPSLAKEIFIAENPKGTAFDESNSIQKDITGCPKEEEWPMIKRLLPIALNTLAARNGNFTAEELFRDMLNSDKAKLEHIQNASTPKQMQKLAHILKQCELTLKENDK